MKRKFQISATALKYLAIVAMVIDHVAMVFVQRDTAAYFFMRMFGRLTAPIMSYFIVEGFMHTRSRKKYLVRLLIFACVSQPFYILVKYGGVPQDTSAIYTHLNVLFTFSLSLLALCILVQKKFPIGIRTALVGSCLAAADICDWTFLVPVWCIVFYIFREKNLVKWLMFSAASIIILLTRFYPNYDSFASFSFMFGVFLAIIPLNFYNGQRSKSSGKFVRLFNRWFFYVFYPLHLLILFLIKNLVENN